MGSRPGSCPFATLVLNLRNCMIRQVPPCPRAGSQTHTPLLLLSQMHAANKKFLNALGEEGKRLDLELSLRTIIRNAQHKEC